MLARKNFSSKKCLIEQLKFNNHNNKMREVKN